MAKKTGKPDTESRDRKRDRNGWKAERRAARKAKAAERRVFTVDGESARKL